MVAVANSNATFSDLLARTDVTQAQLAAHLDALDADERVRQCRALGKKQQRRLWEVCADAAAFTLEDLIPRARRRARCVWAGKNSLALFTHFEKRFQRQAGAVVGYNFNPGIAWFTGPGYFTTVQAPDRPREILFDYTRVPSTAPDGLAGGQAQHAGFAQARLRRPARLLRRVSLDGDHRRRDAPGQADRRLLRPRAHVSEIARADRVCPRRRACTARRTRRRLPPSSARSVRCCGVVR